MSGRSALRGIPVKSSIRITCGVGTCVHCMMATCVRSSLRASAQAANFGNGLLQRRRGP